MKYLLRLSAAFLPWVVMSCYALLSLHDYSMYLDQNLKYIESPIKASREDILGFGYTITWFVFFCMWLVAQGIAYKFTRKVWIILSIIVFAGISSIDLFLYKILEEQIPL